jgi:hypothetical protein
MRREGGPMARSRLISRFIVCVLISLVLLAGGACATSEEDRRKIVIFLNGNPLDLQKTIVLLTGSEIVHILGLINALAIRLPLNGLGAALQSLLDKPAVLDVYNDLVGSAGQVPLLRWPTSLRIPR